MGFLKKKKSVKKKGLPPNGAPPLVTPAPVAAPALGESTTASSSTSPRLSNSSSSTIRSSRGVSVTTHSPTTSQSVEVSKGSSGRMPSKQRSQSRNISTEPTMDMVPRLVDDLATSTDTSGEKPARALRMLFALSEHASHTENRTAMVREADGQLVPVLLEFLRRCERSSSEQYLALLVLNNVSIPSENKRIIALDCGGAHVLARLLCEDPSCHLIAIILVNLTFADAELRKELVAPQSSIQLVDALSYALRLSSLTPEEHNERQPFPIGDQNGTFSPRKLLAAAMAEEQRQRLSESSNPRKRVGTFDPSKQLFPETARWCLCALKNLTRPSKDPLAAHALMDTGVVPLILRIVTVNAAERNYSTSSSSSESPQPAEPPDDDERGRNRKTNGLLDDMTDCYTNSPSSWDSNSIQDAALFTILNMAAISAARHYLHEDDAVHILSHIADSGKSSARRPFGNDGSQISFAEAKQQQFQCLKARMAIAYLVGSEGHYGQPRSRSSSSDSLSCPDESVLRIVNSEAELLVELLANTLHQRAKEGPGGYSAATFTVKGVLYAIRCLLTSDVNQTTFATVCGVRLNALLLKALAQHSIQRVLTIDAEAAEHACFSLYLLSNFGFKNRFLPASIGETNTDKSESTGGMIQKVLTSYLHMENITPAGRHAADQILLRTCYLIFSGSISELVNADGSGPSASDYDFNEELIRATHSIVVEKRSSGAKPMDDIFSRPILRSRAPKKGSQRSHWDSSSVSVFPSALHAVQELSFGSTKVRHMGAIDDIVIANNIANNANGQKSESYNYLWIWQDSANDVRDSFSSQRTESSSTHSTIKRLITKVNVNSKADDEDEPFSIFGFKCGPSMCFLDNTKANEY